MSESFMHSVAILALINSKAEHRNPHSNPWPGHVDVRAATNAYIAPVTQAASKTPAVRTGIAPRRHADALGVQKPGQRRHAHQDQKGRDFTGKDNNHHGSQPWGHRRHRPPELRELVS